MFAKHPDGFWVLFICIKAVNPLKPVRLLGREKIFTDVEEINKENVASVLGKAYARHLENVCEMQFLIDYERGEQPLKREKTVRPDIDIRITSSLPNYIKKFKVGYNWGSPIMLVQRGNKEMHNTDASIDDNGISALNEVLKNGENVGYKDQCMAEFIEICGIGHRMVSPKSFPDNATDTPESLVDIYTLDSRFAFVVYFNGVGQKEAMGVTYAKRGTKNRFTCFTETTRYEIERGKVIGEYPNLLGMIPIVEYERSFDRTGCFERKIPEIDALNICASDFANETAQHTQELWWGNDIDFPSDEKTGEAKKPQSGDWVLTYSSGNGQTLNPKIQPIASTFDRNATLAGIASQRSTILQDCYVPIQYESSGGGSTGTATDMASGWSAAELDALQEQQMTERGKRKELTLVLKAIQLVPSRVLPLDSPIRKVHVSDLELKFLRKKSVDMSIKANTFATLVSHGVHGRHAMEYIDAFSDCQQTWNDSEEMVTAYQKSVCLGSENTDEENNSASDIQNQTENSPIIDGMTMGNG